MVSSQEAARLERDLAHARTNALANGVGIKSRLQALQFELSLFSFFCVWKYQLVLDECADFRCLALLQLPGTSGESYAIARGDRTCDYQEQS